STWRRATRNGRVAGTAPTVPRLGVRDHAEIARPDVAPPETSVFPGAGVPPTPPTGEPAPADGALPAAALAGLGERPFGIYVHVPFCATRCGYCDFNTYTPAELGGANPDGWLDALRLELQLAADRVGARVVDTVFVGGGTPS